MGEELELKVVPTRHNCLTTICGEPTMCQALEPNKVIFLKKSDLVMLSIPWWYQHEKESGDPGASTLPLAAARP